MKIILESVVLATDKSICAELDEVVSQIPNLVIHTYATGEEIDKYLAQHTIQFIVIAKQLGKIKETVAGLHRKYPHIYFLYYFPTLNMDSFQYSDLENFNYIVVGEHRIRGFSEIMLTLSKSYWKKIPYDKFDLVYEKLSPRLKKVMNYIETHGLKECGTSNIARYLTISAGYFSQEFKRETNLNFRDFMQKLLDHYEYIILNKLNLSAKSASQILGYSELSSFSRSFKKRKGYPPSHYKNLEYIEAE